MKIYVDFEISYEGYLDVDDAYFHKLRYGNGGQKTREELEDDLQKEILSKMLSDKIPYSVRLGYSWR